MRVVLVTLLSLSVACSASGAKEDDPTFGKGDATTTEDGGIERDGGIDFDADLDGGISKPKACSADLQSITDESGAVIAKCPSDQGCFAGACIPACEAAAKSKGNVSCNFIAATPSFYPDITPPCFAVFLANNWSKDVKITVTRAGATFDATKFARVPSGGTSAASWPTLAASGLPPGKVAVLFLSSDPSSSNGGYPLNCPVDQAIPGGTAVTGTGKGTAFIVKTDAPVSGYDILPYGGATSFLPSAQLLLPATGWGTNYVAALPPKQGPESGPLWSQVIASENGTTIKINPTFALAGGGGAPSAPAGSVTTFTLNAGEYVQWQNTIDITGSILSADKPIAFTGGTGYLCLKSGTSTGGGCDSGHQMIPPISALGFEYVAPPYVTRRADLKPEAVPYRIVGTVDGTKLTYDPPIAGAPATLSRGSVSSFEASTAFVIKSDKDHPFYVGQMMAGATVTSGSRPGATVSILGSTGQLGDEEYVNVLPPAQFLSKYVFFTDPTYSTTNLVLTRAKVSGAFKDVKVDCLGTVTGWTPVGSSGQYESVGVDLVRGMVGVGSCTNGPHVAESAGPFGLMVWGTDTFASYAYPGGGNIGTINTVVVDPVK